jgi:type IV secretory pathway VirJ component
MTRTTPASRCRSKWFRGSAVALLLAVVGVACAPQAGALAAGRVDPRASHAAGVSADASVAGLPLIEVPASDTGREFAVLISGDGGWAPPDKGIANTLAAHGVPVVGLNALRYFVVSRTPDGAAGDLARILRHYAAAWGRDDVVVIGYSRGADIAPSMVARLPDDLRRRVVLVVLLGPSEWTAFTFAIADWIWNIHRPGDLPVRAELERLRGTPVLCIYGRRDHDAICPSLDPTLARPIARPGGHIFDRRQGAALADTILRALPNAGAKPPD